MLSAISIETICDSRLKVFNPAQNCYTTPFLISAYDVGYGIESGIAPSETRWYYIVVSLPSDLTLPWSILSLHSSSFLF